MKENIQGQTQPIAKVIHSWRKEVLLDAQISLQYRTATHRMTQFAFTAMYTGENTLKRRESLFWLMVSETLIQGWLALLLWVCGVTMNHQVN